MIDRYTVKAVADITGAEEEDRPLVIDRYAVEAGVKAFDEEKGSWWMDRYGVGAAADEGVDGGGNKFDKYAV